jgi:hypothetical protein
MKYLDDSLLNLPGEMSTYPDEYILDPSSTSSKKIDYPTPKWDIYLQNKKDPIT